VLAQALRSTGGTRSAGVHLPALAGPGQPDRGGRGRLRTRVVRLGRGGGNAHAESGAQRKQRELQEKPPPRPTPATSGPASSSARRFPEGRRHRRAARPCAGSCRSPNRHTIVAGCYCRPLRRARGHRPCARAARRKRRAGASVRRGRLPHRRSARHRVVAALLSRSAPCSSSWPGLVVAVGFSPRRRSSSAKASPDRGAGAVLRPDARTLGAALFLVFILVSRCSPPRSRRDASGTLEASQLHPGAGHPLSAALVDWSWSTGSPSVHSSDFRAGIVSGRESAGSSPIERPARAAPLAEPIRGRCPARGRRLRPLSLSTSNWSEGKRVYPTSCRSSTAASCRAGGRLDRSILAGRWRWAIRRRFRGSKPAWPGFRSAP